MTVEDIGGEIENVGNWRSDPGSGPQKSPKYKFADSKFNKRFNGILVTIVLVHMTFL